MTTERAKIRCPGCGAHIEVTATVPSDGPEANVPVDWTPWLGGECPVIPNHTLIDCRFESGVENYSFKAWSVNWANDGSGNRVAYYRKAIPFAAGDPPSYTRWK